MTTRCGLPFADCYFCSIFDIDIKSLFFVCRVQRTLDAKRLWEKKKKKDVHWNSLQKAHCVPLSFGVLNFRTPKPFAKNQFRPNPKLILAIFQIHFDSILHQRYHIFQWNKRLCKYRFFFSSLSSFCFGLAYASLSEGCYQKIGDVCTLSIDDVIDHLDMGDFFFHPKSYNKSFKRRRSRFCNQFNHSHVHFKIHEEKNRKKKYPKYYLFDRCQRI